MSESAVQPPDITGPAYPVGPPLSDPPPDERPVELWIPRQDLVFAGIITAVLVVLGALAGVLWWAISDRSKAIMVSASVSIPEENEKFISADGRFLIITGAIGIVAGLATWLVRSRRGPVTAAALAFGCTLGALLTAVVGHLISSGHASAPVNQIFTLRLALHARGLIALEGGLALLVYLVGVLFVGPDDLGRPAADGPDPAPTEGVASTSGGYSAPAGGDVQGLGGDGNGAGHPQDGQFTP